MKKKKTLLKILLVPLLCIVLAIGILPYLLLKVSGIRSSLESSIIQMDSHIVENRQVVLENEMIEHWAIVYKESDELSTRLGTVLEKHQIPASEFLENPDLQQEYLQQVFPVLTDFLQYNTASGLFLVLANTADTGQEAEYCGFFLRDSDPQTRIVTNTDLLLERGSKKLSQGSNISLDSSWSTNFHLKGNGKRSADDFFYQPYLAALSHKDTDMDVLGYWAKPFILEDHEMDNHQMITYSIPLKYDDSVYGVLGVEIGIDYLNDYFPVRDLDSNLNAGYALAVRNSEQEFTGIAGKGALYKAATMESNEFTLTRQAKTDAYRVNHAEVGSQEIYCVYSPLNLYSSNVPYEDTDWNLCGFVSEDSIYGMGAGLYRKIILAIGISILVAAVVVWMLVRYVTKPVYRLVESVRCGVEGIHGYEDSNIIEIDELHDVVESLTDIQKQDEEQLLEEKERYRIAVENSRDMFFIYRAKESILEIVNSKTNDGTWDCKKHPEYIRNTEIHPQDRDRVYAIADYSDREINLEFRLRLQEKQDYEWVSMTGSILRDPEGNLRRIVGCIRNIHKHKLLEEEQKNKQYYDSLTSYYRLEPGLKAILTCSDMCKYSTLMIVDIKKFAAIDEQYGLVLGDVLVEQLARLLDQAAENRKMEMPVRIRAGADQLMLFYPGEKESAVKALAEKVYEEFTNLIKEKYYALSFQCGITGIEDAFDIERDIMRGMTALNYAKHSEKDIVLWEQLPSGAKEHPVRIEFMEIDPINHLRELSLPALAMNIFDRGNNLNVILDVLTRKILEKYSFENLVIMEFSREELASSCIYLMHETEQMRTKCRVSHCRGTQYQRFVHQVPLQELLENAGETRKCNILGEIGQDEGIVYHMLDNAQYSGSILFVGMSPEILQDELMSKQLEEIAVIIQNKINLLHHDQSARAKSDFLARMSHEIRTPMNGIIGMTEIALQDGQSDARRVDCLKKIESSSNYLLGLLNDILDMSKIESGKMKLVYEPCNLRELVDGLRPLLETKIAERRLNFTQEIQLQHDWFECDGLRLNQVLVNFLSNAVKYSRENGFVRLTVREKVQSQDISELYFEVSDDGIGIEKNKQQYIFQSFTQADNSETARRQGTGLGLAISSRLVHMMDSEICLESEPDVGSTFSFTVRFKSLRNAAAEEKEAPVIMNLQGKRVLAVEDNTLNMEIVRTILEDCGIRVEEAYNGREAVTRMEHAAEGYYDLILMDIMMPVMDGLEATRRIRQMDRADCKTIPIIAMSANAFDEDVQHSLESGMTGHLSKPLNMNKMKQMISQLLSKQG